MAEIRVERKRGRNIWPLIIGLLVVLAVLWFVLGRNRGTAANTAADAGRTSFAPMAAPRLVDALMSGRSGSQALAERART